jgi:hypothetical protein
MEYYLIQSAPTSPCTRFGSTPVPGVYVAPVTAPPLPTLEPTPTAIPPAGTPPPDTVGDGTHYVPLDSPAPSAAPAAAAAVATKPPHRPR